MNGPKIPRQVTTAALNASATMPLIIDIESSLTG